MRYNLEDIEDCREVLRKVSREYIVQSEDDDDCTLAIKRELRRLPSDEQVLFILYTEVNSYRILAKIFGVSRMTIFNKIKTIKEKIRGKIK